MLSCGTKPSKQTTSGSRTVLTATDSGKPAVEAGPGQWRVIPNDSVVGGDNGRLVDVGISGSQTCGLFESGLVRCVHDATKKVQTLFAANPAMRLREPLSLEVAGESVCVASDGSAICRTFTDAKAVEVQLPSSRYEGKKTWQLHPSKHELCDRDNCVSLDPQGSAQLAPLGAAGSVVNSSARSPLFGLQTEFRLSVSYCEGSSGDKCLFCAGGGVCGKWKTSIDILNTAPIPARVISSCAPGQEQVEKCPTPRVIKAVTMSPQAKAKKIVEMWKGPAASVELSKLLKFPSYDPKWLASDSAICVVLDYGLDCATNDRPSFFVKRPDISENGKRFSDFFLRGTDLCFIDRRRFQITCSNIENPPQSASVVALPASRRSQSSYEGPIRVGNDRICFPVPNGDIACAIFTGSLAPKIVSISRSTLVGTEPTVAKSNRDAAGWGGTLVFTDGEYICRNRTCIHALTGKPGEPGRSAEILLPYEVGAEFAGYRSALRDNGFLGCTARQPKDPRGQTLQRLANVTLSGTPMESDASVRCATSNSAAFDVNLPWDIEDTTMWSKSLCRANGDSVECMDFQQGATTELLAATVGFEIESIMGSNHVLCVSTTKPTKQAKCWWKDPTKKSTAIAVTVPADFLKSVAKTED
jgi:hypothetical protein